MIEVKINDNGEIDINDLKDIIDVDAVEYYSIEAQGIQRYITFYDRDKKMIKPKQQEKQGNT